jgi:hypothetical protein
MTKDWFVAVNHEHAKIFNIEQGRLEYLSKLDNPMASHDQPHFAAEVVEHLMEELERHGVDHLTIAADSTITDSMKTALEKTPLPSKVTWFEKDCAEMPTYKIEMMIMEGM